MGRFVFFHPKSISGMNKKPFERLAAEYGVTVIQGGHGAFLVEATPTNVQALALRLPDWRWTKETFIKLPPRLVPAKPRSR